MRNTDEPTFKSNLCTFKNVYKVDIKEKLNIKVTASRFKKHLVIATVIGVIWRLVWINVWASHAIQTPDYSFGYSLTANSISQGHFNALTSSGGQGILPPLFSIFLGLDDFIGINTPMGQANTLCIIFSLGIILSGLAAKQVSGYRAGMITCWLVALSPTSWLYSSHLIAENLIVILIPGVIYFTYKWWYNPKLTVGLALGIVIALAAMSRTEDVALIPFLVFPVVMSIRKFTLKLRLFDFGVILVAFLLVLSPILYGNIVTYKYFDPLSAATGTFLLDSNCPTTYYTKDIGAVDTFCFTSYPYLSSNSFQNSQSTWDNSQTDYAFRHVVFHYIWANRDQVPNVIIIRALRTWHLINPMNQNSWDIQEITTQWPLWIQSIAFIFEYFLYALLGVGLIALYKRRIPILPILIFPLLTTTTIVLAGYLARYRISLESSLLISAGIGIDALLSKEISFLSPFRKIVEAFKNPKDTKLVSQVYTWLFWAVILIALTTYGNVLVHSLPN